MTIKRFLLAAVSFLAKPLGLVPFVLRRGVLRSLLLLESRIGSSEAALRHLLLVQDDIERLLSERATAYGGGTNPKHRLTLYHEFFIERIGEEDTVLDIGCGIGAVARSIASARPKAKVVGIDYDPASLAKARSLPSPENLSFLDQDALHKLPEGPWDVIILSNVLEHIAERVSFLKSIIRQARPRKILVRVPMFERSWHMPLRRELKIDFRSDPTHYIEHTLSEFEEEMAQAGLRVTERLTLWGEIWASCEAST
ncbi:MAG: methyltransferase domain-containing protein [Alphaproteobacteria bacterium]|nr:methyltransferase domain-containing protein [Alphaproteobacteria bacterium]